MKVDNTEIHHLHVDCFSGEHNVLCAPPAQVLHLQAAMISFRNDMRMDLVITRKDGN